MSNNRLGFYELLAPQFLLGFTFPEFIDRYLSKLWVDELRTAYNESGVIYSGTATFTGEAGAQPVREHRDPGGAVFEWEDVTLQFRLTLPRDGAAFIRTGITAAMAIPGDVGTEIGKLGALFDALGLAEDPATAVTDYPGVRFRLELLVTALTFHLPRTSWIPGEMGANHRVVPRQLLPTDAPDVRFVLPKVVMVYEQGDDLTSPPSFRIDSWGNSGFDAPADLAEGEVVRMEPPIALHRSGRFAFGVDEILLDLSPDHTPAEILSFFGTDENFKGIYVKSARVYYADENKDFAINAGVNDVLISFSGEVSLEAQIDFLGPETTLHVGVKFYQGNRDVPYTRGKPRPGQSPRFLQDGRATILNTGVVHLEIAGGIPPYTVSVKFEPQAGPQEELWNATTRQALISPGAPAALRQAGTGTLVVSVTDSGPAASAQNWLEEIELTVRAAQTPAAIQNGMPSDSPPIAGALPEAAFSITDRPVGTPDAYSLFHSPAASGTIEQISVRGNPAATAMVNGIDQPIVNGRITLEVAEATSADIEVRYPAMGGDQYENFNLYFDIDKPDPTLSENLFNAQLRPGYVNDTESPYDERFSETTLHNDGVGPRGVAALSNWINTAMSGADEDIAIDSYASFERAENVGRDQLLSERRLMIARDIILAIRPAVTFTHALPHGHFDFNGPGIQQSPANDGRHRVARIRARTVRATPAVTITATISRAARPPAPPAPVIPQVTTTKPPQPPANEPPGVFRRLSFRIRLERNVPVLLEVSGELDFETEMESRLRQQVYTPPGGSETPLNPTGNLGLTQQPNASRNPNPADGVVDFMINVTYDTATNALTETLSLGSSPDDLNGLLQMTNPHGVAMTPENRFKDAFGGVLMLAPVINSAASALDPNSAGDWAVLGASLAIPAGIGALGILRTEKITLYGGELKFRQFIPPGEALTFTDAGVVFDYGVEFGIKIDQLGISTTRPLKVRYKAVGFNLHFGNPVTYQPIFDTSKGYELDLGDPGLFKLPAPLDEILKILGARIARFNPLTLEVDLGMKVDLGVVQVDRFKVKWPIDPLGIPSILPTSARIEIAGTLIGSGSVNIVDAPRNPPPDAVTGGGFDGMLDVSLVAVKLRIVASLGIRDLNDPAHNRRATAVFAGLIVDFPAPLPLGQSGLGLLGLSGLFAMHYKRLEPAPVPQDSVGPALHWLADKAKGEPAKLIVDGVTVWGPELDRWSFGVGAMLGTMDGGFIAQLRGMFVLELPGPRILIFVKITIVKLPVKGLKPAADLKTGILGVLDLDFNLGTITVGVIVDFEIKDILVIKIPIELFFNLNDSKDWHFYLGTFSAKITARVLNLVNAYGYFMVSGKDITGWPGREPTRNLPGIAVAAGISASITIGDEDIGLYLRVAAGVDLAVAFSPYFMVGRGYLDGELRLFIISIEAHGVIDVEAPNPTYVFARICGKVDFFFFSVEGCVKLSIGSNVRQLPAPPLVRNLFLQSHAPVLTAGQAGDGSRPIDASLGNAAGYKDIFHPGQPDPASDGVLKPVVPIDSVPVVQLHASPDVSGTTTFTEAIKTPPFPTPGYYINVGGDRKVKYILKEIRLDPPLPSAAGIPPATWRPDPTSPPTGVKTNIDLALMSRVPITGERALERSSDLHELINISWENLCKPVAPPVCVLWTFCRQLLGPSGEGWVLHGIAQSDPPGTVRSSPPITELKIEEPRPNGEDVLAALTIGAIGYGVTVPAEVIGPNLPPGEDPPNVKLVCLDFGKSPNQKDKNPRVEGGLQFEVFDFSGVPVKITNIRKYANFVGLDCSFRTEIILGNPSQVVDLKFVTFASEVRVSGFNKDGTIVTAATTIFKEPESIRLIGTGIIRIVIEAKSNETLLMAICTEPQLQSYKKSSPVIPARVGITGLKNPECYRALKLPMRNFRPRVGGFKPDKRIKKYMEENEDQLWVTLDTGEAVKVTLLLALTKTLVSPGGLRIRQLGVGNVLIDDSDVVSFPMTTVTGITTGLPGDWIDPAGPWIREVLPAATFLAGSEFSNLNRLVVTLELKSECRKVQLIVPSNKKLTEVPAALLSVIIVCPQEEVDRVKTAKEAKQGELETLTGYLNGDADVPLLEIDTDYTLTIRYDAISRAQDSSESTETDLVQKFHFHTDNKAPKRIDPWMFASMPKQEERDTFYEDPIKLVFNDTAIVQLYKAYGKKLRAVLHSADGVPIPAHEVVSLDTSPAELTAPYREFLEALVSNGLLPCVGSISMPSHGITELPLPLRPLMAYTLDLEIDPTDPIAPADADKPVTPLFRRSFTTGRFPAPRALIEDLIGHGIRHRALSSPISGLPYTGAVTIATDEVIQASLINAGEEALPAASVGGTVVYWAKRSGETNYSPHAILIDSPEALWRMRYQPVLELVPGQVIGKEDPAYKRIVPAQTDSMRIAEQGGPNVQRFVRSISGTRTLVFISDSFAFSAGTARINLIINRPGSGIYKLPEENYPLLTIPFGKCAPWEEEE